MVYQENKWLFKADTSDNEKSKICDQQKEKSGHRGVN
jgi:hypothetical protein